MRSGAVSQIRVHGVVGSLFVVLVHVVPVHFGGQVWQEAVHGLGEFNDVKFACPVLRPFHSVKHDLAVPVLIFPFVVSHIKPLEGHLNRMDDLVAALPQWYRFLGWEIPSEDEPTRGSLGEGGEFDCAVVLLFQEVLDDPSLDRGFDQHLGDAPLELAHVVMPPDWFIRILKSDDAVGPTEGRTRKGEVTKQE